MKALHSMKSRHNTGLYNIDGEGGYPHPNEGLYSLTETLWTWGASRPRPFETSAEPPLICMMEAFKPCGKSSTTMLQAEGPSARASMRALARKTNKSEFVAGFIVSEEEIADLIAFWNPRRTKSF